MGIHLWIWSNFVAVCLFLFQWSSSFSPSISSSTKKHKWYRYQSTIEHRSRLSISQMSIFFEWVSERERETWKKPIRMKIQKENYKCATNQVVCSCRLLKRNFAINAQLAHMCNIFWYTIHSHTHTHTLNIQTSILAINFQSLKSAFWLIKWLGFRIFVLIIYVWFYVYFVIITLNAHAHTHNGIYWSRDLENEKHSRII